MKRNITAKIAIIVACILVISWNLNILAQVNIEEAKQTVIDWADENAEHISEISHQIWEYAEVGLTEFKSSDLLVSELEKNGFDLESGLAVLPTSFVGTYIQGTG